MIHLLWRLIFGGCDHKWEVYERVLVFRPDGTIAGYEYQMRCVKCGNMKVHRNLS